MLQFKLATTPTMLAACRRLEQRLLHCDPYLSPSAVWWLVTQNTKVVGACALGREKNDPNTWYLARAAVVPAARGRGLQRKMLRLREHYARARGAKCLVSYTIPTNGPSIRNLLACGYEIYEPRWNWAGEWAVYFRKDFRDQPGN